MKVEKKHLALRIKRYFLADERTAVACVCGITGREATAQRSAVPMSCRNSAQTVRVVQPTHATYFTLRVFVWVFSPITYKEIHDIC